MVKKEENKWSENRWVIKEKKVEIRVVWFKKNKWKKYNFFGLKEMKKKKEKEKQITIA